MNKLILGCEEWCMLPALELPAIKIRIDSGAKTSSLHAFNIHVTNKHGVEFVEFDVHPIQKDRSIIQHCKARLVGTKMVKSSSGHNERRFVIKTPITLGGETWEIEIGLSNRDSMGYRMLLGREAMKGRILVDPDESYRHGDMDIKKARSCYKIKKTYKNSLKILLLASNPQLYSNRRIMEAAEARGHEIMFINVRKAYMNISKERPAVFYDGDKPIDYVDAVIPRLKPAMTFYGCAVTRQFQSAGAFCLNDYFSIRRSRDKLLSLQMLAEKGMDMPITSFANSPDDTHSLIKHVGGAPVVIKLLEGTQGMGVVLAETKKAAESVINAFKSLKADILVQEFVKEAEGEDIRCFVIDGKVVGAMKRIAAEGEFRANIHRGGRAEAIKITKEERKMAVHAAKIIGLKVAGVDIIRSKTGPKILEVNSSPGLEGIESVTGKDIAGMMIEAIEKNILGKALSGVKANPASSM